MLLARLFKGKTNKQSRITQLVQRLFYTKMGQAMISLLFGLAIAFMFQKVCKGSKCIVIEAPPMDQINGHVFGVGDECYEYVPRVVPCAIDDDM